MVNGKIGTAVIGYGGMGSWHTQKMLGPMSSRMQLLGIYDIKSERCAVAEENGIHAYSSREELLEDDRIDFVVVATPNDFHREIVIAALEAGKNVMSEKPVTMTSEMLEEMIAASERTGKMFTVHQNRRFDPDYLTIKKIFDDSTLGRVFNIQSRVCGSRGIPGDWRQKKSQGGGMILDWGIHILDQALMLLDDYKLESVYTQITNITNDEVDDGFSAELRYEGGITYHLYVGTSNFINLPRWYMQGENGTAVIDDWDINGKIVMVSDWENRDAVPITAGVGLTKTMAPRTKDTIKEYPLPYVENKGFDNENSIYENIADTIEGKATQIVTLNQQRRLIKVVEAMFESAEKNIVVKF
jgi:scyllo-inositol 2-dehydrogenase (NADP+)